MENDLTSKLADVVYELYLLSWEEIDSLVNMVLSMVLLMMGKSLISITSCLFLIIIFVFVL